MHLAHFRKSTPNLSYWPQVRFPAPAAAIADLVHSNHSVDQTAAKGGNGKIFQSPQLYERMFHLTVLSLSRLLPSHFLVYLKFRRDPASSLG